MISFGGRLLMKVPQWLFLVSKSKPLEHLEFNTFSMETMSLAILKTLDATGAQRGMSTVLTCLDAVHSSYSSFEVAFSERFLLQALTASSVPIMTISSVAIMNSGKIGNGETSRTT